MRTRLIHAGDRRESDVTGLSGIADTVLQSCHDRLRLGHCCFSISTEDRDATTWKVIFVPTYHGGTLIMHQQFVADGLVGIGGLRWLGHR
jgi:hypothetical protein